MYMSCLSLSCSDGQSNINIIGLLHQHGMEEDDRLARWGWGQGEDRTGWVGWAGLGGHSLAGLGGARQWGLGGGAARVIWAECKLLRGWAGLHRV